ncbi:Uncharacterised protein [Candidatus Burarchaeum australiense]|nr:Uncharacterised protein [Candidatus Burarchaeum australiense]
MQEELVGVNAELRYITVELMKIASQRNVSFEDIAQEYINNVYFLDTAVRAGRVTTDAKARKVPTKENSRH